MKERTIRAFLQKEGRTLGLKIPESDIEVDPDGEEILFVHEDIASVTFDKEGDFAIVELLQPERGKATVEVFYISAGEVAKSETRIGKDNQKVKFYLDEKFTIHITRRIPSGKEVTMVVNSSDSGD